MGYADHTAIASGNNVHADCLASVVRAMRR